ncbi:nuclear transport factor 2 family protein [Sphingomonas sediminicola]|uniref:nuclear transport factor 2 family protein n=1 Tax=Sphingomonas sediminicola TaxID=386874 RepID=UPI001965C06C|nr:nuclear transport factor 2 family protein ['Sphingomonas ginsengisoli' Hoang et al. 2012]
MKYSNIAFVAAAMAFLALPSTASAGPVQEANKRLVSSAMHELFVTRNATKAVRLYFGKPYLQHNPTIADGADDLPKVVASLPKNFKYEPGVIVADGDLVMIHGRYTGWGPKPLVTVDIFRVKNGKLVEHWDVMQEDVPAAQTKSHRPMFPITR